MSHAREALRIHRAQLVERAEASLKSARERLANMDDAALAQVKEVAKSADEYVREHPWGAVGIAAVAGLLLGVLISRR